MQNVSKVIKPFVLMSRSKEYKEWLERPRVKKETPAGSRSPRHS